MSDYNTERERRALKLLRNTSGTDIVNPTTPLFSRAYETAKQRSEGGMKFWTNLARHCAAGVAYLPNRDSSISSGVAGEVIEAFTLGHPVYEIVLRKEGDHLCCRGTIPNRILSIEETSELIDGANRGPL
jgi:hypothetical protein